jgi:FAD/FMN-containing dehydrogenase
VSEPSGLRRRELIGAAAAGAAGLYLPFRPDRLSADWHARAARDRIGKRELRELRRRLRGRLILPGERGYERHSAPANFRYDHIRPFAIARCANERDVRIAVEWAAEHGVRPVARGGGHSYAGYSATRDLIVDLSRLNQVAIDSNGLATVGGAALNNDLLNATVDGPFVLPGGTCLGVGVGGLVLGGGIGYNTHWGGLTCDHLRSSRIVMASGEVRTVSRKRNPDLFWACRGGAGGNFGINTLFTFRLPEVPRRRVSFFRFDYRGADAAAAVLSGFDRLLADAPPALNAVAAAQAAPVGSGGPREAIDVFTRGQYIGPQSELEELVRPLRDAATPIKVSFETTSFWDRQRRFASAEAVRHGWGDISRYSRKPLPQRVYAELAELLAHCPHRDDANNGSIWSLGWVGGDVVGSVGKRETAYVHRDALTLLRATPVWAADAPDSVRRQLMGWSRDVIAAVDPHTPRRSYQNFPNRAIPDWRQQYYGSNYSRLTKVKGRHDPDNVFRNPQSIRPRDR